MILETVYVIVQFENSVSLAIEMQLFFILVSIPLNPLNYTFFKKLSVLPAKYGNLPLYLRLFKLSETAYKRRHGHCDRK